MEFISEKWEISLLEDFCKYEFNFFNRYRTVQAICSSVNFSSQGLSENWSISPILLNFQIQSQLSMDFPYCSCNAHSFYSGFSSFITLIICIVFKFFLISQIRGLPIFTFFKDKSISFIDGCYGLNNYIPLPPPKKNSYVEI